MLTAWCDLVNTVVFHLWPNLSILTQTMADSDRSRSPAPGATELILMNEILRSCDPTCRSSHVGGALCRHRCSKLRICHDLSSDLRWWWLSRALTWIGPCSIPTGRATSSHRYLHPLFLHHLHQLCHIHDLIVQLIHHVHQLFHAHLLNHALQALHRSHHPNLVASIHRLALHRGKRTTKKPFALMGLIQTHSGRATMTTMTTRKSMDWHFQSQSVNRPSPKSWTLKGVILLAYHWRLFCINRPTTSGFGNWLMFVSFTSSLQGTSQLLFSWRSSWHSSEQKASIWTRFLTLGLGKMEKWWTRRTTPSMPHSKSRTSFTAGSQCAWQIPKPSTN